MPLSRHWFATTLAAVLVAGPALAAPSQVAGVTVFPDRARVTRTVHVDLARGVRQAVFTGLPADLDPGSVRASGRGVAQAAISGLEVHTVQLGAPPESRTKALEGRIQLLDDKDRDLAADIESHRLAQQTLRTALNASAAVLGASLASRSFDPKQWLGPATLVEAQDARLAKAILAAQRMQRELSAQRDLLRRELAALRGFQAKAAKEARVFLDVAKAGGLDVTLTYDVPRASWAPTFDVALAPDLGRATLAYRAQVIQRTGEDWTDARVTLSSGRPDLGAAAPELGEWTLDAEAPDEAAEDEKATGEMSYGGAGAGASSPASRLAAKREASRDAESDAEPVEHLEAALRDGGTAVQFEAARPVTLPGDGRPHQVPIGERVVAATASYRVVPQLSPHAYLTAELANSTPWPLLGGQIRAHVGTDFVGTANLGEDVAPGATFSVSFGADRQIKVNRTVLKRQSGDRGFFVGKRKHAEYGYKIALTNQKAVPVRLDVVEAVPVSRREDIVISLSGDARARDTEPGKVAWSIVLPPGGRREIVWGYAVEWPQELRIAGLE